jgi:Asp-tRNA(Asn)/Glu-tRNA(Gln) amidotransferase A subunit family amidase
VIPVSKEPAFSPSTYTKADTFKSLRSGLPGKYHSIADYHQLYLAGELTPLAVAESLLPLIRRDVTSASSHSIAFVDSNVELVLQAAKASTQRYKEGKCLGLLDGVPAGIKDECDVAGYRTFFGRKRDDKLFEIKAESSWPVQKWQEAGVIIMGKLNMHEVGSGESHVTFLQLLTFGIHSLPIW